MYDQAPAVGRPRGAAWRSLQAEGIVWEGQVLIVGEGIDLAARLIVTHDRLAFARGGDVALDVVREWLYPAPRLRADGLVALSIAPEGGEADEIVVDVLDGREEAAYLVGLLEGGAGYAQSQPPAWSEPRPQLPPQPSAQSLAMARPITGERRGLGMGWTWPEEDIVPPRYDAEPFPEPEPAPMARHASNPAAERWATSGMLPSLAILDRDDFPPIVPSANGRPTAGPERDASPLPSWRREPEPAPAPAAASSQTVASRALPPDANAMPRHTAWLQPIDLPRSRSSRKGWAIRLSGLILLLIAAAAFGAGRLPDDAGRDLASRLPASTRDTLGIGGDQTPTPTPTAVPTQEPIDVAVPTPTSTAVATHASEAADANLVEPTTPPLPTALALGVGGESEAEASTEPTVAPTNTAEPPPTATVTATATSTPEPTATNMPEPTATAKPTQAVRAASEKEQPEPTSEPSATATVTPEPTATPTAEPTATMTATAEPTSTATAEPTSTATPEPTNTPPPAPTNTPPPTATQPPPTSTAPAAATGTSTAPATATIEPTATTAATPTPGRLPPQAASVGDNQTPAPVAVSGGIRYTVESATRGAELPNLALPATSDGEWVVLIVYAQNWSEQSATMSMDHFTLATLAPEQATASVDSSSPAVAQFLGIAPAYRASDAVLFAPGEGHQLVLVFLVDPSATTLQLHLGETAIDLENVSSEAGAIDSEAAPPATELLRGTVIEVIDGETIRVEIDGEQGLVRYSGISAPTGDACYATQATNANQKLVEGKTVWLERQRFNTAGEDALTRDVWVESGDGGRQLVAEALVAQGAAIPQIREPDTRFAGWLDAAAAAAEAKGAGVWGACGGRGHG